MRYSRKAATIFLIFALLLSGLLAVVSAAPTEGAAPEENRRDYYEPGDETHSFADAKELSSGDVYYGGINRVDDRSDYFKVDTVLQEVINVHIYITGHDGIDQWVPPDAAPPTPGRFRDIDIGIGIGSFCGARIDGSLHCRSNGWGYIQHTPPLIAGEPYVQVTPVHTRRGR